MVAGLYALGGVEMALKYTGPLTRVQNAMLGEASHKWISQLKKSCGREVSILFSPCQALQKVCFGFHSGLKS